MYHNDELWAAHGSDGGYRREALGDPGAHLVRGGDHSGVEGTAVGASDIAQGFRHLVESSPGAVFVHDGGRVVYVNPAALRSTGAASADQLLGRLITEFVDTEAILVALTRPGETPEPVASMLFRLDGKVLDVEAITSPTIWAGRSAYQTVLREISAGGAAQRAAAGHAKLVDHVPDAVIATTRDGVITHWNPAAETLYGRHADAALGRPISEAVGAQLDPSALAAGGVLHVVHYTASGAPITVRISTAPMGSGFVLVSAEQPGVQRAGDHFQSVVNSLDRGIIVLRRDGSIHSINPAAERILGYGVGRVPSANAERALDFPVFDTDGHVLPAAQRPANITSRTGQSVHDRVLGLRRHDGHQTWISFTSTLLDPDDAERSLVLLSLADVTTEHLTNQQLRRHAHHDALTGLPNRVRTLALITAALTPSENPQLGAVMFIDIDQLKQVNDTLGHHAGDQVLIASAERLQGVLRSSDTLTRVGGDEFVVLIAAPANIDDVRQVAERLHDALKGPVLIDGQAVTTSASIGVTVVDTERPSTPTEILRRADTAMYQAKASGPGRTRFYAPRNGTHYRLHDSARLQHMPDPPDPHVEDAGLD